MCIAFGHVGFAHTCGKMANCLFQGNVVAKLVGSIHNDCRHTDNEVN